MWGKLAALMLLTISLIFIHGVISSIEKHVQASVKDVESTLVVLYSALYAALVFLIILEVRGEIEKRYDGEIFDGLSR